MGKIFISLFDEHVFTIGQSLFFEFCGMDILVTVTAIESLNIDGSDAKMAKPISFGVFNKVKAAGY